MKPRIENLLRKRSIHDQIIRLENRLEVFRTWKRVASMHHLLGHVMGLEQPVD